MSSFDLLNENQSKTVVLCSSVDHRKIVIIPQDDVSILEAVNKSCGCKNYCLRKLSREHENFNFNESVCVVRKCRKELFSMKYNEIKDLMRDKIKSLASGKRGISGRLKIVYKVPLLGCGRLSSEICHEAFANAYGITHHMIKSICKEINSLVVNSEPVFNDRTRVGADTISIIRANHNSQDVHMSREQEANLFVPNTDLTLKVFRDISLYLFLKS